jgi:flagellar motor switch/type III secretory pathway protein FliN
MNTSSELVRFFDVPLPFEAVLPGPAMRVDDLLALSEGSLILTGQPAGETFDVFAAGVLIGVAELAETNGRRAVRMVRFHAGSR